eukprot:Sdes_comp21763_c0_seq1m20332
MTLSFEKLIFGSFSIDDQKNLFSPHFVLNSPVNFSPQVLHNFSLPEFPFKVNPKKIFSASSSRESPTHLHKNQHPSWAEIIAQNHGSACKTPTLSSNALSKPQPSAARCETFGNFSTLSSPSNFLASDFHFPPLQIPFLPLLKYPLENLVLSSPPRGLLNFGNVCYMNSVLQSLISCPPFSALLFHLSSLLAEPPQNDALKAAEDSPTAIFSSRHLEEFSPLLFSCLHFFREFYKFQSFFSQTPLH